MSSFQWESNELFKCFMFLYLFTGSCESFATHILSVVNEINDICMSKVMRRKESILCKYWWKDGNFGLGKIRLSGVMTLVFKYLKDSHMKF